MENKEKLDSQAHPEKEETMEWDWKDAEERNEDRWDCRDHPVSASTGRRERKA